MSLFRDWIYGLILISACTAAKEPAAPPAGEALMAFAGKIARDYSLDVKAVSSQLAKAQYQQSVIDAITRPAEAKPWYVYRPLFLTEKRIAEGQAFLTEHAGLLAKIETNTGVPAELIVAILGVETHYGRNTGNYRVLDSLYTLGFHYPPRQDFFRDQLGQLFALANEEKLDLVQLKGSYAGAMGWGQFMPSSYRNFALDGDSDGKRDLFASIPDILASVANYLVAHGWQRDQAVAVPALADAQAVPFNPGSLEAKFSLAELAGKGYRPVAPMTNELSATLLTLEGVQTAQPVAEMPDGDKAGKPIVPEYWITFGNFYVISRYNRSSLYCLAVYQLAQAIATGSKE